MKYLFTLISFLYLSFSFASTDTGLVVPKEAYEKWVKEGRRQYINLQIQNAINTKAGCPENNRYVFSFLPDEDYQWIQEDPGLAIDGSPIKSATVTDINNKLIKLNELDGSGVPKNPHGVQMYVCLVGRWYIPLNEPINYGIYNTNTLLTYLSKKVDEGKENQSAVDKYKEYFVNHNRLLDKLINDIINNHPSNPKFRKPNSNPKPNSFYSEDVPFHRRLVYASVHIAGKTKEVNEAQATEGETGVDVQKVHSKGYINKLTFSRHSTYLRGIEDELWSYVNYSINSGKKDYSEKTKSARLLKGHVLSAIDFLSGELDADYVPLDQMFYYESFEPLHSSIIWEDLDAEMAAAYGEAYDKRVEVGVDRAVAMVKGGLQNIENELKPDSDSETDEGKQNKHPYDEDTFYFILNEHAMNRETLSCQNKCLVQLEHKLAYLYEETGIIYMVLPIDVNFVINGTYGTFSNKILNKIAEENNPLLEGINALTGKKVVLVTLPYTHLSQFVDGDDYQYTMPGVGFSENMDNVSLEMQSGLIYDFVKEVYKQIEKPHRVYAAYLPYSDGYGKSNVTSQMVQTVVPYIDEVVKGKLSINELALTYDKRIDEYIFLSDQRKTACRASTPPHYFTPPGPTCNNVENDILALSSAPEDATGLIEFKPVIKEKYLEEKKYRDLYTIHEYNRKFKYILPDSWKDDYVDYFEIDGKDILYNHDKIEYVYGVLDIASLALTGTPFEVIPEGLIFFVGAFDAGTADDASRGIFAMTIAGAGVFIPLVSGSGIKMGNRLIFLEDKWSLTFKHLSEIEDPRNISIALNIDNGTLAKDLKFVDVVVNGVEKKMHRGILDNSVLVKFVRDFTDDIVERRALITELKENPKLLTEVFDKFPLQGTKYWRMINSKPALKNIYKDFDADKKIRFLTDLKNGGDDFAEEIFKKSELIDMWKMLDDITDETANVYRTDVDVLKRLSTDITDNSKLKAIVEEKGGNGFLAWKYLDDSNPNVFWCK